MSELDDIRKRTKGHTPGEFSPGCFVNPASTCKCRYIFSEHYMGSIAAMSTRMTNPDNDSPPEKEQRANAHLLAAAPDLLRLATEQEAELESLRGSLDEWKADFTAVSGENAQLRTERDRYKMALEDIEEYTSSSPIHMGKWVYERARAALTQREGGNHE